MADKLSNTLSDHIANMVSTEYKTWNSAGAGANTGWIAWANDDKLCIPVIEQGSSSSSQIAVNVDCTNKKYRLINTYSGTQNIVYWLVHFK